MPGSRDRRQGSPWRGRYPIQYCNILMSLLAPGFFSIVYHHSLPIKAPGCLSSVASPLSVLFELVSSPPVRLEVCWAGWRGLTSTCHSETSSSEMSSSNRPKGNSTFIPAVSWLA
ncbi:hypothetical protein P152DRAFT_73325 [Eremomyces bilateralis CBS 781.70]|uniref:Uncharacterized protein n=1 Tax=Eremomyces bilateralis CBS 781.70 TaxID=1392243 RepID=A0A6G1FZJ7_9PEZI|nr:uncharacterized protein P152DRAFT_73325 [Eremomyces bilateralis CBS 781.70]KAF1810989.1 hypothetical protein P152DRAFT_73325 [Eremomyces bilateralis CBS 781.70]